MGWSIAGVGADGVGVGMRRAISTGDGSATGSSCQPPRPAGEVRRATNDRCGVRWRKRARHRACRGHSLARGAPHPDRYGCRYQHGGIDRRRIRQRHGRTRARDVHCVRRLGSPFRRLVVRAQEHSSQGRRPRISVAPRIRVARWHRAADRFERRRIRRVAPGAHRGAVLSTSRPSTTCQRPSGPLRSTC